MPCPGFGGSQKGQSMVSVVMLGASGAVGGEALRALDAMAQVTRITVLNRRPLAGLGARIGEHIVDVGDPDSYRAFLAGHDAAICTLGVGEPSKSSREEFTRVDHDMPLAFAQACKAARVAHFSLLSAVGATSSSRVFYIRSKGELEDSLRALGFARLSLFHPSMILTPSNRYGASQAVALAVWPWLTPVLAGPLRKYRGIRVRDLGRAMALNTGSPRGPAGTEVLEWDQFMAIGGAA